MPRNYRYVIEALSAKHARLQGLSARDCSNNETFRADIEAVKRVIRMYAPDWQPLPPINPRGPSIMGRHGAMTRSALDVLRTADHPLTAMEVASAVADRAGFTEHSHVIAIANSVRVGLRSRVGRGVVLIVGYPRRWVIKGIEN